MFLSSRVATPSPAPYWSWYRAWRRTTVCSPDGDTTIRAADRPHWHARKDTRPSRAPIFRPLGARETRRRTGIRRRVAGRSWGKSPGMTSHRLLNVGAEPVTPVGPAIVTAAPARAAGRPPAWGPRQATPAPCHRCHGRLL